MSGKLYPWGDKFKPGGKFAANTYQGQFPVEDKGEDGFAGIAPVKSFPPNGYGLYDMAGNVWQWCSDWYRPDYFQKLSQESSVRETLKGRKALRSRRAVGKKRVHKGGSFLCNEQYAPATSWAAWQGQSQ